MMRPFCRSNCQPNQPRAKGAASAKAAAETKMSVIKFNRMSAPYLKAVQLLREHLVELHTYQPQEPGRRFRGQALNSNNRCRELELGLENVFSKRTGRCSIGYPNCTDCRLRDTFC